MLPLLIDLALIQSNEIVDFSLSQHLALLLILYFHLYNKYPDKNAKQDQWNSEKDQQNLMYIWIEDRGHGWIYKAVITGSLKVMRSNLLLKNLTNKLSVYIAQL